MFAPRVVKAKSAKTERSAVASRVCVVSPEAGAHDSDENAACMTNSEAAPSWDLSKISIISFSNQERPQIPDQFPGARPAAPIQAKLRTGSVNDPLEHEAERVADQVTRMPTS